MRVVPARPTPQSVRPADRRNGAKAEGYTIPLPSELVDALADQVAEKLAAKVTPPPEPYIGSEEAAEYIGYRHAEKASAKMSELAKSGKVRFYRDGRRLLFRCSDLDEYLATESGEHAA